MNLRTLVLVCVAGIALLFSGAGVWADNIDFSCSLSPSTPCSGTITSEGSGNFSTTGISVYNDSGPYSSSSAPFMLIFDMAAGTISIDGTGANTGQNLVGVITSAFSAAGATTTDVSFTADWPSIPTAVQTFLGTPTGTDSGFVIALSSTDAPLSVDVAITPAPEPGSLALLGVGLAAFAGLRRRKMVQTA